VVAESVLVEHQLILNRSRKRSLNLRSSDRMVAGLCALFLRPGRCRIHSLNAWPERFAANVSLVRFLTDYVITIFSEAQND
jgi:hypothetical protein